MRENIWEGGAVYILIGETFDILAEASGDELCTHKVIMRPLPTNQQAAAHNRHLDLQRCRHRRYAHTVPICQTTVVSPYTFPPVAMLVCRRKCI